MNASDGSIFRAGDGFVDFGRNSGAGSIFKADGVEGNFRVQNLLQSIRVEVSVVSSFAAGRKFHQCDADLMFQAGIDDALTAVDQIVDVVQCVEVANGGDAVLLEQFGVQSNDVAGLRFQTHDVYAAGQSLQVGIGTGRLAESVHHRERVFVAVKVERLEAGSAACFKPFNAGVASCFDGRQKIFREHASSVDGLKSVSKRGAHEVHFFLHSSGLRRSAVVWVRSTERSELRVD